MLLAIDTSTRTVGVALYDGTQVLSELVWYSHDYHTVELAPAVAEILDRVRVKVNDLNAIGVALGPGSFTGLRIGLALAKGIALGRHLPLIGVPTLDVLAEAQMLNKTPLVVVLRAGRGRLVVRWYHAGSESWQPAGELEVVTIDNLSRRITEPTRVCGEFTEEERRVLSRKRVNVILASPAQSIRRPSYLAELAWKRWKLGQVEDPALISPIYLHHDGQISK